MLQKFLSVLKVEAKVRKNFIQNETIETIYLGGGTPSVLSPEELAGLLTFLKGEFSVKSDAEITLEANPDDLGKSYLKGIINAGVNRLSLGVQSFHDDHLKKMNRRHNVLQAIQSIETAASVGFTNISVDLIYGLPGLTQKQWEESLNKVYELPVQHLSAYHLTYHEGTPFYTWLKKGSLKEVKEEESITQFNALIDFSLENGYKHYEISNLAKNGLYSKHNTAYWFGKKYLGLGPSAHSFDGNSRQWNVSSVNQYIKAVEAQIPYREEEQLTEKDKFNEYILTRIRTMWGLSISYVNQEFGSEMQNYLVKQVEKFSQSGNIIFEHDKILLSRKGLFISDEIMTELMII